VKTFNELHEGGRQLGVKFYVWNVAAQQMYNIKP